MPKYTEAIALMLFNSEPGSAISERLLRDSIDSWQTVIKTMQCLGELKKGINVDQLARCLSTSGWFSMLLWFKELLSDEAYRQHYANSYLLLLTPVMTRKYAAIFCDPITQSSDHPTTAPTG